jgi:hypothetical protein
MSALDFLINKLEPNQKEYLPEDSGSAQQSSESSKTSLATLINEPFKRTIKQWGSLFGVSAEELEKLDIDKSGRRNSLYSSFLVLTNPKFNYLVTHDQKNKAIEKFLGVIISKMEKDTKIKMFIRELKIKPNDLHEQIRTENFQSQEVVYYISLVFDVNIIVLTDTSAQLYYSETTYDNCKPHILLYQDNNGVFHSIIYEDIIKEQLLVYHDTPFVQQITGLSNLSVINKIKYQRNVSKQNAWGKSNLSKFKATELRRIADYNQVNTKKPSETTGRLINKLKDELRKELEKLPNLQIPADI